MNKTLAIAMAFAVLFALIPGAQAEELETLLKGVRSRYGTVKDMKADFSQETMVKVLGRKQTKSGTVAFKRPDKMIWDYKTPEKQQLLTDGVTLWVYQPEDKVVFMRKLDAVNSAKVPMQILSGEIDVNKQFEVYLGEKKENLVEMKLIPKEKNAGYEKAVLFINATTFNIDRIDVVDMYQNITTLNLTNTTFNNNLSDSEFVYTPKPGVRVESAPVIEF